jgi:hypothetical protein
MRAPPPVTSVTGRTWAGGAAAWPMAAARAASCLSASVLSLVVGLPAATARGTPVTFYTAGRGWSRPLDPPRARALRRSGSAGTRRVVSFSTRLQTFRQSALFAAEGFDLHLQIGHDVRQEAKLHGDFSRHLLGVD